jgi:hypothetical protein
MSDPTITVMAIVSLCFASCPFAVAGFIIAIVVDALNRQRAIRAFAHIGKEVLKTFPSFADFDATSTVTVKGFYARILAPLNHCPPNRIFRSVPPAVRAQSLRADFAVQTTAGLAVSSAQRVANNNCLLAACAFAEPCHFSAIQCPAAFSNDRQPAECFTSQINKIHENILYYLMRAVNTP